MISFNSLVNMLAKFQTQTSNFQLPCTQVISSSLHASSISPICRVMHAKERILSHQQQPHNNQSNWTVARLRLSKLPGDLLQMMKLVFYNKRERLHLRFVSLKHTHTHTHTQNHYFAFTLLTRVTLYQLNIFGLNSFN